MKEGGPTVGIFAYGYGTYLDGLEVRPDAIGRILDSFSDKQGQKFIKEWKKFGQNMDWDEYLYTMIQDEGIDAFLARLINENEFGGKQVFMGEELALYMPLFLPKNEQSRNNIPLEKDVKDIIDKYVKLCYKGFRKSSVDYYYFETVQPVSKKKK